MAGAMSTTLNRLVRLARPYQWVKNSFVLVGLLFGHAWGDGRTLRDAALVFAAFCLASSAVYVFNDIADRAADRAHPQKRRRPVASGEVGFAAASSFSALLALCGLALALAASPVALAIVAAYLALNTGYSLGLKHVAILDVFIIAAGFMLRILAGTLGIGIAPSQWLLLCGMMLTVFLGFAKRRAELIAFEALDGEPGDHRRVLADYSPAVLDRMIAVSAGGVIVSYALYTVSSATALTHGTGNLVLTLPFVLYGVFRYLWLLHRGGGGGDPSRELLRDAHLLGATLGWLAVTVAVLSGVI
jgi:4-hydroxybenzoate polyprenyltransferase